MSGETARIFWLEITGVMGMIALGLVAHGVARLLDNPTTALDGDGYLAAAVVAGTLGLLISPAITAALWRTRLDRSIFFVFGLSGLVTVVWLLIVKDDAGISAAIPAVVSVILLSLVARQRYPDADYLGASICPECGYNLSGCTNAGCPECGWDRRPDAPSPEA